MEQAETHTEQAEIAAIRLAAIIEFSDDAIIGKTLDGIITSWNRGAERLFGHAAAETIGRSILLLIPPERLDEEATILSRLCRGERIEHFETQRITKIIQQFLADGTNFTAEYGSKAYGVGFEGKWQPIEGLSFSITGDWPPLFNAAKALSILGIIPANIFFSAFSCA
jgi:PAS domain S-box-containing protein